MKTALSLFASLLVLTSSVSASGTSIVFDRASAQTWDSPNASVAAAMARRAARLRQRPSRGGPSRIIVARTNRPTGFTPLFLTMDMAMFFPSAWVGKMITKESGRVFRIQPGIVVEVRCPVRALGHDLVNIRTRDSRVQKSGSFRYDYTFQTGTPKTVAGAEWAVITIQRSGSTSVDAQFCEVWGPVNGAASFDVWQAVWDNLNVPATMR